MPDPRNVPAGTGLDAGDPRLVRGHAPVSTEDVLTRDQKLPDTVPLGMWGEAWRRMRRRPLFWGSMAIIALVAVVAMFPGLFTSVDPRAADLRNSLGDPVDGHPFGFPVPASRRWRIRSSACCRAAVTSPAARSPSTARTSPMRRSAA